MSQVATMEQPALRLPLGELAQMVRQLTTEQWLELCRQRDEKGSAVSRPVHNPPLDDDAELDDWLDEMEADLAETGYDASRVPSLEEVREGLSTIRGTMAQAVREERDARG